MQNLYEYVRWAVAMIGGAVMGILVPTLPYLLICSLLILADCYTAWCLGRRVARLHPESKQKEVHKFASSHFGRVIITLLKSYSLIVIAYLIEQHITNGLESVNMVKIAAGAICFWQLWSILENESSCNGAKWAKTLQRILVDKTSRHFDIDLSTLKTEKDDNA